MRLTRPDAVRIVAKNQKAFEAESLVIKKLVSLSIALLLGLAAVTPASTADYYGKGAVVVTEPTVCNDHSVLSRIVSRFDYADRNLLGTGLAIQDFSAIRLTRYEGTDEKRLIERFYCQAYANMSDNQPRPVWYLVETGMGYAGIVGDNVEFCVSGLDPLKVYGANCRSLQ